MVTWPAGASMCFLALLTFVMAMLVCTILAVPGVYMDTIVVAPNDTVMAAYEVDRQVTDNIMYSVSSSEANVDDEEELVFYREVCDYIKLSSVEVHISQVSNVPTAEVARRAEIGHLYLVTDSSLHYTVNLTFSSPAAQAPQDCYASVHLFKSYSDLSSFLKSNDTRNAVSSHQFCNGESTLHFTLDVPKTSYYFLGLYTAANRGKTVKSAGVQIDGTIFYYDASLLENRIVCRFFPSAKLSCTVPIGNNTQTNYENLCILITRGSPYIPGTNPGPVAMGNTGYPSGSYYVYGDNDVVLLQRSDTTYWGINRIAVFVCLFALLMMSCCVLTILTPRRTNYGSYVRTNRKKKPVNRWTTILCEPSSLHYPLFLLCVLERWSKFLMLCMCTISSIYTFSVRTIFVRIMQPLCVYHCYVECIIDRGGGVNVCMWVYCNLSLIMKSTQ